MGLDVDAVPVVRRRGLAVRRRTRLEHLGRGVRGTAAPRLGGGRQELETHDAAANVRRALGIIDAGDEVRLNGLLVDVASDRGLTWQTSLVRTDHGDRGCEIVWVESVQIGSRVYR